MTCGTHVLSVDHLVRSADSLEPGVHPVPRWIEDEVAGAKLHAQGVRIDELTDQQRRYLADWRVGT